MKTIFAYVVVLSLAFLAACGGYREERGATLLTLISIPINGECGQPYTPFHIYTNNSGSDQVISITVKATGKCPITISTKDAGGQDTTMTNVASAAGGASGSGTTSVRSGKAVEFGWSCKVFEADPNCTGEVTLHLHAR